MNYHFTFTFSGQGVVASPKAAAGVLDELLKEYIIPAGWTVETATVVALPGENNYRFSLVFGGTDVVTSPKAAEAVMDEYVLLAVDSGWDVEVALVKTSLDRAPPHGIRGFAGLMAGPSRRLRRAAT